MPDADSLESEPESVEITHFINPHVFWYRKCNHIDREFVHYENDLQQYALRERERLSSQSNSQREAIKCGDRVVVYFVEWSKWLRCSVDVVDCHYEKCILWAIDYGIPIQSTIKSVVPIANHQLAHMSTGRIAKAAICNALPLRTAGRVPVTRRAWSSEAVKRLGRIKRYRFPCTFTVHSVRSDLTILGILTFIEDGRSENFGEYLIGKGLAKAVANDSELNKSLEKTMEFERWLSNDRQIVCKSNIDEVDQCAAAMKVITLDSLPSPLPTSRRQNDSSSAKSTCSEEDVVKYFKKKRRYTQKREENGTNDGEKAGIILTNVNTMAYKSLCGTTNGANKNDKREAPTSTWTPIDEIVEQDVPKPSTPESVPKPSTPEPQPKISESALVDQKTEAKQCATVETKRVVKDLRHTGETKIRTIADMNRILVHSNGMRIRPVNMVNEVTFTPEVVRVMRDRFSETYKSQSYAWPHLMRGHSVVLIDSANRGKTIAYVPALCARLQENLAPCSGIYNQTQLAMGAKAIILCANVSAVEQTVALCRLMMNRIESEVVQAIGARNTREVAAKLYNGCSIFVTTVPCLLNMMRLHSEAFAAQKLSFFVFDNADMIINRHGKENVVRIFKKFCKQNVDDGEMVTQVVITARTWQSTLQFMRDRIPNPLLLIGNFMEAAMYGNMNIQINLNLAVNKLEMARVHVKNIHSKDERLLIVCNNSEEVQAVHTMLSENEIACKSVTIIPSVQKNRCCTSIEQYWNNKCGDLICTDEVLREVRILSAQHILHFSMPERFDDFLFRLSSTIDCYADKSSMMENRTSSLFLIDEKNNKQLPKLINFLERKGGEIADNVLDICQKIRIQNDKEKAEKLQYESICNYLFMHGRANHESACRDRHLIMPGDASSTESEVPCRGDVRLKLLHIHTPTRYSVQLLSVRSTDNRTWQTINQSNAFVNLQQKLNSYYSDEIVTDHRELMEVELNMLCAIEDLNGWHRGRIIKIAEKKNIYVNDVDVDVRLIDDGTIMRSKSIELRPLANEFVELPAQAIDLHLIGLVPADQEDEWDSEITNRLQNYLLRNMLNQENTQVEARIVFSLRRAVIVDCLRVTQTIGCDCAVLCSIKKYMIEHKLGMIAASYVKDEIYKMVEWVGIDVRGKAPKTDDSDLVEDNKVDASFDQDTTDANDSKSHAEVTIDVNTTNPIEFTPATLSVEPSFDQNSPSSNEPPGDWATLPDDSFIKCDISYFLSPDHFFLTPLSDAHMDLLDEIDEYTQQFEGMDSSIEMPDIGMYCLAKADGGYNRALILNNSCINGVFLMKVFRCDVGDILTLAIENIMSIPDPLLKALPFQAICCRLHGIRSTKGKWTKEQSFQIYDEIIEPIHKELKAKAMSSQFESLTFDSELEMKKFSIVLRSDSRAAVNRLIVENGWATYDDDVGSLTDLNASLSSVSMCDDASSSEDADSEDEEWERAGNYHGPERKLAPEPQLDDDTIIKNFCNKLSDSGECKFDTEDLFQLFGDKLPQPVQDLLKAKSKSDEPQLRTIDENANESTDESTDESIDESQTIAKPYIPAAKYKYKVPQVTWKQSDELIVLQIKADENVPYNLNVTCDQLVLNAEIHGETNVLVINFFGCIDTEYVSHEIRGLNIIVHLIKSVYGWDWPRLCSENVKFYWLHHDHNAIRDFDDTPRRNGGRDKRNARSDDDSQDDNGSDSEFDDAKEFYED